MMQNSLTVLEEKYITKKIWKRANTNVVISTATEDASMVTEVITSACSKTTGIMAKENLLTMMVELKKEIGRTVIFYRNEN